MTFAKRIVFGLLIISVFVIGYVVAATITSTQVPGGIRVSTQSSVKLLDAQGATVTSLDFGSAPPGGTSTISTTSLVLTSNDQTPRYVIVTTDGLPTGFLFSSPQQGDLITPGTPLSMSFTVTVASTAAPQQYSWNVLLSISDTHP